MVVQVLEPAATRAFIPQTGKVPARSDPGRVARLARRTLSIPALPSECPSGRVGRTASNRLPATGCDGGSELAAEGHMEPIPPAAGGDARERAWRGTPRRFAPPKPVDLPTCRAQARSTPIQGLPRS